MYGNSGHIFSKENKSIIFSIFILSYIIILLLNKFEEWLLCQISNEIFCQSIKYSTEKLKVWPAEFGYENKVKCVQNLEYLL